MKSTKLLTAVLTVLIFFSGCENMDQQTTEGNADTANNETNIITQGNEGEHKLQVRSSDKYGEYLADSEGMSLYMFQADDSLKSTCYDDCAMAWPPYTAEQKPEAGEGVEAGMISTFRRENGEMQVAYNGWPLYYYKEDKRRGDVSGQDVEGFGAEWYLLKPNGEIVHMEGGENARSESSTP